MNKFTLGLKTWLSMKDRKTREGGANETHYRKNRNLKGNGKMIEYVQCSTCKAVLVVATRTAPGPAYKNGETCSPSLTRAGKFLQGVSTNGLNDSRSWVSWTPGGEHLPSVTTTTTKNTKTVNTIYMLTPLFMS